MPTYAYVCEKCGAEFEAFASIQKKESGWQPTCPKCSSPQTRQVFKPLATIGSLGQPLSGNGCCSPRGG